MSPETKQKILETFSDADLSLIEDVLYFDGWADYEEDGGILVFKAVDGTFQIAEYGYCVMADDHTNRFFPLREVSFAEAQDEILEMKKAIENV